MQNFVMHTQGVQGREWVGVCKIIKKFFSPWFRHMIHQSKGFLTLITTFLILSAKIKILALWRHNTNPKYLLKI